MAIYGNEFLSQVDEASFIDKESIELIKKWKTSDEFNRIKKFKSTTVTKEDYDMLQECINVMRLSDKYGEYKKAFTKFCSYCHIMAKGTIIVKYELIKGSSDDNNSLYVEYSYNTKKITLPEGTKLYHMSTVEGITELIPQFRGKSQKGYLYDKPRIYFTIRKEIPKLIADYKITDKVHKYLCKKDIKEVYVDPLVRSNIAGAVYIETTSKIPVEEVGLPSNKKENNSTNEQFDFDNLFNFVMENGFQIIDE